MKIGLFNTEPGGGGAAIACKRLYQGLLKNNTNVRFIHVNKDVYLKKLYWYGKLALEKIVLKQQLSNPNNLFFYSTGQYGHPSIEKKMLDYDIVHLHYINQGFISLKGLHKLAKHKKKIVWTLHDMWPFTGGCHYSFECTRYKNACGNCFYLKNSGPDDLSSKINLNKQKFIRDLDITFLCPSQWIANCAAESSLFSNKTIQVIRNPLSKETFSPVDKKLARKELGLEDDKYVILFGAANIDREVKGGKYLIQSLFKLKELMGDQAQKLQLVILGNHGKLKMEEVGLSTTYAGFVTEEKTLCTYYSAADVFTLPSLMDNLPNTLVESIACGTPAIGFNVGGVPEIIKHQYNGFIANERSSDHMAEGLKWILLNENYAALRENARKYFLENFEEQKVIQNHLELYNSLL